MLNFIENYDAPFLSCIFDKETTFILYFSGYLKVYSTGARILLELVIYLFDEISNTHKMFFFLPCLFCSFRIDD